MAHSAGDMGWRIWSRLSEYGRGLVAPEEIRVAYLADGGIVWVTLHSGLTLSVVER